MLPWESTFRRFPYMVSYTSPLEKDKSGGVDGGDDDDEMKRYIHNRVLLLKVDYYQPNWRT